MLKISSGGIPKRKIWETYIQEASNIEMGIFRGLPSLVTETNKIKIQPPAPIKPERKIYPITSEPPTEPVIPVQPTEDPGHPQPTDDGIIIEFTDGVHGPLTPPSTIDVWVPEFEPENSSDHDPYIGRAFDEDPEESDPWKLWIKGRKWGSKGYTTVKSRGDLQTLGIGNIGRYTPTKPEDQGKGSSTQGSIQDQIYALFGKDKVTYIHDFGNGTFGVVLVDDGTHQTRTIVVEETNLTMEQFTSTIDNYSDPNQGQEASDPSNWTHVSSEPGATSLRR